MQELYESRAGRLPDEFDDRIEEEALEEEAIEAEFSAPLRGEQEAEDLVERSRNVLPRMHAEDREEAIDLHEKIGLAIEAGDEAALAEASRALRELLFFMEGKPN